MFTADLRGLVNIVFEYFSQQLDGDAMNGWYIVGMFKVHFKFEKGIKKSITNGTQRLTSIGSTVRMREYA